jgi:multidrug efflux pump subunit AcrA (membrane-fusion protein)
MSYKKIALRCLIVTFSILLICLIFGRTWINLTLPRVTLVSPIKGVINKEYNKKGRVVYEQVFEPILYDAAVYPITIEDVLVDAGDIVKKGDILMRASLSIEHERTLNDLENLYTDKLVQLTRHEFLAAGKGINNMPRNMEKVINWLTAETRMFTLKLNIRKSANQAGIELDKDETQWNGYLFDDE